MAETLNLLLDIIRVDFFIAFGLYSVLYVLLSLFYKNQKLIEFDIAAVRLINFLGLVYLVIWLIAVSIYYFKATEDEKLTISNRMFGPYWYGFWIQTFLFVAITQLLRFEKIQRQKFIRLLIAFFMIISIEQIIIMLPTMCRGFIPSTWNLYITPVELIFGILFKLTLFVLATLLYAFTVNKLIVWCKSEKKQKKSG